jgi:hypothetical protein
MKKLSILIVILVLGWAGELVFMPVRSFSAPPRQATFAVG